MVATASQKLQPREDKPTKIVNALNRVIEGRVDSYASVTLTPSATSTEVSAPLVSENSTVVLSPRSASAAAAVGAGNVWVSAKGNGTFTLSHNSDAALDRHFDFAWIG